MNVEKAVNWTSILFIYFFKSSGFLSSDSFNGYCLYYPFCLKEFTMHDTIGCYLDLDRGQISFSKNGIVSLHLLLLISEGFWCSVAVGNTRIPYVPFFVFLLLGNDLGVAFDIPQHVKNQPFFASCVLKVQHHLIRRDGDYCHTNKCLIFSFFHHQSNRMQS